MCLACLCFRVPGEQQECLALLISLVLFVYWCAWPVCVSGWSNLFIGVLGLFVFQGAWRATGRFSVAFFPSFVCLLVCLACLCFRVPGE